MKAENTKYTEIKTAMLVHVPFFSSLLFDIMNVEIGKFPHIFGELTPTAATDGKNIYIDEEFLAKLKLPEAVFLVCHEIGHAIWQHLSRGKFYLDMGFDGDKFNPRLWNIAGDYVINDMLVKSKLGNMPSGGLIDSKYTNEMLVEDVYRDLKKNNKDDDGAGADGLGNDGSTMDVHILAPANMNEAELKRAVQTALDAAKAVGKVPMALERFATQFLTPQVSWKERLRYHITRAISRDTSTWAKPHRRRLITQKIYYPAYTGYGAGEVVVAIDTSGSVGEAELNRFFSELDEILATCNPERVVLLGCDAAVSSVHELVAGESLKDHPPKLGGGGGTDFNPVFNWIEAEGVRPSALIYFTDMYGAFPATEPVYPTIWCKTSKVKAPWGEEIEVDLTEK